MHSMNDMEQYIIFIYELGMLKRIQREGWKLLGIVNPESVAEHSLRAAQIGFILAKLEDYDNPEKICTMLVFHDIGECRIGDIHKVANRYVKANEKTVVLDQTQSLGDIGESIFSLWDEIEQQKTTAGIIAKDADLLEMIVTACELKQKQIKGVENWFENTKKRLKTQTAKRLFQELITTDPNTWWSGLKKFV